ncbi:glutathione-dependent formaldehyde-activating [Parathielavia hyrcaniae]|uniref:Glutathione-dependent formaldehyde-activating n=1 Tax=Parathielavia hyrcaniae TaxID=113614 RepID=A0AAN6SZF6_9PEZI|nr:glutathione-dependent formaldehyde-activating [Parathielavia hyrcaniae]
MDTSTEPSLEGGCACGFVRYRLLGKPLIVHCCHCKWCQRETGSAFVINALFSSNRINHLKSEPATFLTSSESGKGQTIARCPAIRFVRVGTLDQPQAIADPDVHIYTQFKMSWVELPSDVPAFDEFYDVAEVWGKETDERRYARDKSSRSGGTR